MSAENVSGVTPFLLFQSVLRVKVSRQCPWSIIVIFFSSPFSVPLSNLAFASNSQTDILCVPFSNLSFVPFSNLSFVPFSNLSFASHSQTDILCVQFSNWYPLRPILKLISFASDSQTYPLSLILKCIILCVPFSKLSCASHSQTYHLRPILKLISFPIDETYIVTVLKRFNRKFKVTHSNL